MCLNTNCLPFIKNILVFNYSTLYVDILNILRNFAVRKIQPWRNEMVIF
jgi:hypothetical protein